MKVFLYNPDNGSPIKNWYDGNNFWSLPVGECAAFPERAGAMLKATYGFLQNLNPEEFELRLGQLEKEEVDKVKVGPEGGLIPKVEDEMALDKKVLEKKKVKARKTKKALDKAKDAEPEMPNYYKLSRGALIVELQKRKVEIRGLNTKGVWVNKDSLINLLENDDASK